MLFQFGSMDLSPCPFYSVLVSKYPSLATDKNTTFQFCTGISAKTAINATRFLDQKPAPGGFYKVEGQVSDAYENLLNSIKASEDDKALKKALDNLEADPDHTASWIDEEELRTFLGERGKWLSTSMIKNSMHRDFIDNYSSKDFFSEEDGLLNFLPMGVVVVCKQVIKIDVDDKTANYLDIAVEANAKLSVAGLFEGQANAEVKVHKDRSPGVDHYDKWIFESNEPMVLGVFSKINTLHH
jgi:hypothetical protein